MAATKIQAGYRGFKTRKAVETEKASVVIVTVTWLRMWLLYMVLVLLHGNVSAWLLSLLYCYYG